MPFPKTPHEVVDIPLVSANSRGDVRITRPAKLAKAERPWCAALMAKYDSWHHLLDLKPAVRVDVEFFTTYENGLVVPASLGLPRLDALVRHADNSCTIVETKIESAPAVVMGGVGQLLYYRAWVERVMKIKVDALVLAAPTLPPLVLEAIWDIRANIKFLKATDSLYSGLVPEYPVVP